MIKLELTLSEEQLEELIERAKAAEKDIDTILKTVWLIIEDLKEKNKTLENINAILKKEKKDADRTE
tara:strand:- start:696 stop:896 length:201 start_codon:yes stop_codon:yes gene_type:complete